MLNHTIPNPVVARESPYGGGNMASLERLERDLTILLLAQAIDLLERSASHLHHNTRRCTHPLLEDDITTYLDRVRKDLSPFTPPLS